MVWSEVLSAPKEGSARICDLVAGDLMRIKVNASGKPEKTKYFLRVILPDGKEGYVRNYDVTEFRSWARGRLDFQPIACAVQNFCRGSHKCLSLKS